MVWIVTALLAGGSDDVWLPRYVVGGVSVVTSCLYVVGVLYVGHGLRRRKEGREQQCAPV